MYRLMILPRRRGGIEVCSPVLVAETDIVYTAPIPTSRHAERGRLDDTPNPAISTARDTSPPTTVARIPSVRTSVPVERAPTTAPQLNRANNPPNPSAPRPRTFRAMTGRSARTGAPN